MARREQSLSCKLTCVIGMRHTLMVSGIDAEMREFGQSGIRCHERELLAAPADEIETLLTMLKLRDDWQGREMAWHLQWLLLKAETRERRRSLFKLSQQQRHCQPLHHDGENDGAECGDQDFVVESERRRQCESQCQSKRPS